MSRKLQTYLQIPVHDPKAAMPIVQKAIRELSDAMLSGALTGIDPGEGISVTTRNSRSTIANTGVIALTAVGVLSASAAAGAVTLSIPDQGQNKVLAAPIAGAGAPEFRFLDKTDLPALTTDDIAEAANLYYTSARADGRVQAAKGSAIPQPLGTAAAGIGTTWAPIDHVHAMPSAADVGAQPAGSYLTTSATTDDVAEGVTNLYFTTARASAAAPVQSVAGRTGAITLAVADVSGAAPLASPALAGIPTAPTAAAATNSTQIATTAYVKSQGYTTNVGTVTSVALNLPSIFSVTGSPVTTSGTLTAALANQAANAVFAGPGSGAAAAPAFRALVAADIPDLSATYSVVGHTHSYLPLSGGTLTGVLASNLAATTDAALAARISTDTNSRLAVYADGKMEWGAGGVSSRDTTLYRSAANTLKTDDGFQANSYAIGTTTVINSSRDVYPNTFRKDSAFSFLTTAGQAQQGQFGSVFAHTNYSTGAANTPTNGIYGLGNIRTDGGYQVGSSTVIDSSGNATFGRGTFSGNSDLGNYIRSSNGVGGAGAGNILIQQLSGANAGFQAINFNGYYSSGETRYNTAKNRWRVYVDQRSTTDKFVIESYDGTTLRNLVTLDGATALFDVLNGLKVGGTQVIDSTRNGTLTTLTLNQATGNTPLAYFGGVSWSHALSGQAILRNLTQLRFTDGTDWSYNAWAGLKFAYDSATPTSSIIYLGGPASGAFSSNASPSLFVLDLTGLSQVRLNGTQFIDSSRNLANIGSISDATGTRMDANGGWFRTYNSTGWYNQTYLVGIYANESGKVKTYNNAVYHSATFEATSGDGNGFRFWQSDNYKIYMAQVAGTSSYPHSELDTASDYNMYYRMAGAGAGAVRGHVWYGSYYTTGSVEAMLAHLTSNGYHLNVPLKMGTTTVIDSSRNLTNIGNIGLSGTITFNGGATLYGSGTNAVVLNDTLAVTQKVQIGSTNQAAGHRLPILMDSATKGSNYAMYSLCYSGAAADSNISFGVRGNGYMEWGGGGASATDTNLYRSAANTLKTDDAFDCASIVTESWTAPSLGNSWVNFGSPYNNAGYYKDKSGRVHLRGLIKSGTTSAGTIIFTLPNGYQPAATELRHVIVSPEVIARIDIQTNGNVVIGANLSSNAYLSLDGVSFRAA